MQLTKSIQSYNDTFPFNTHSSVAIHITAIYLPPVNAEPFAAPKVEHATKTGITQAITPYS